MAISPHRCRRCHKDTEPNISFCSACYYPGIEADWQCYRDLIEEGYPRYQALVMAGLADPAE